jgi:hypothetical protein
MQDAIALTWETLAARVRNYRLGAFASLGFAFLMILLIIFCRTGWLLAGLPGLYLIGYAFVHRDQDRVAAWEERILADWEKPDFFMGIFAQSMGNHPTKLGKSLKGMITLLPPDPDNARPQPARIALHRAVAATRHALQRARLYRAGVRGVLLACLPLAVWLGLRSDGHWAAYALALLPVWTLLEAWMLRGVKARWRRQTAALEPDGLACEGYSRAIEALDWKGIPARWRREMGGSVSPLTDRGLQ